MNHTKAYILKRNYGNNREPDIIGVYLSEGEANQGVRWYQSVERNLNEHAFREEYNKVFYTAQPVRVLDL